LVTSDVPKKLENASVTGSCGSSLITFGFEGSAFTGSSCGAAGLVSVTLIVAAGVGLGRATVAALGLGGAFGESDCFVDRDIVGLALGAAKNGVCAVSFGGGTGSLGGVGSDSFDTDIDDEAGGSRATGLFPLMILPSESRYSSTPAFVTAFKTTF
jgi:hypothetical protein